MAAAGGLDRIALAGLVASGATDVPVGSVVSPPFNAYGTVRCTMSGTHTIKPGITTVAKAGVVEAVQGEAHVHDRDHRSERGHGAHGSHHGTEPRRDAQLLEHVITAVYRDDQVDGELAARSIRPGSRGGGAATREPAKVEELPRLPQSSRVRTRKATRGRLIVSDTTGQPACATKTGMKRFKFTGLGGASTFEILDSPSAVEVFRDDFSGTAWICRSGARTGSARTTVR